MDLKLANHSSYPRIGDQPDHQALRRAIAQRDKGENTDADVRQAEDRMIELALREQIDAGLDIVTDGQIRWYDPVSHLASKLAGVRINGLLRFFDTNFYFRQPVIHSKLERTRTVSEPGQKANERAEAIERGSVSGEAGWGWQNQHSDSAERPKRAALAPRRGQRNFQLTRWGGRARLSGEREAQNGNSG